jgi:hypothetical protein
LNPLPLVDKTITNVINERNVSVYSPTLTKKKSKEILNYKPLPFQVPADPKPKDVYTHKENSLKRIPSSTPITIQPPSQKNCINSPGSDDEKVKNTYGIFHE